MEELTSPLTARRPKPKSRCFLLTICVLSAFCNGVFLNIRGPCVKDIADRAGITSAQMGWFFIASGAGGVLAALPAGKVIDSLGNPMTTLCAGLVVRAITCFGLPFVTSAVPLMLIGVAQGMTLPVVGVSLRASILWTYGGTKSTPYLNLVMAAFGFGSMVAPLLYDWFAVLIVQKDTLQTSSAPLDWTFWGLSCFCLLMAGASLCVDRSQFDRRTQRLKRRDIGSRNAAAAADVGEQEQQHCSTDSDVVSSNPPPSSGHTVVFFLLVNLYMAVSVGIECTVGNWICK